MHFSEGPGRRRYLAYPKQAITLGQMKNAASWHADRLIFFNYVADRVSVVYASFCSIL